MTDIYGIPFACFWGFVGGFLAELAGLYKYRTLAPKELPAFLTSWFYWLNTVLMILAGGLIVWIHYKTGQLSMTPWLAANLGGAAPFIIGNFSGKTEYDVGE